VLEAFDLDAIHLEGYAFQIETVYQSVRRGFRIKEVPIVFPDRKVGKSKMSKAIVAEAFTYVIRRRLGGAAHGVPRQAGGGRREVEDGGGARSSSAFRLPPSD
jgi:dolichol-phosphate mannosyltransferase